MTQLCSRRQTLAILFLLCSFCGGCRDSDFSTDPPAGETIRATNVIRQKLGVREIKDTWSFYGRRSDAEDWLLEGANAKPAKRVQYDKEYKNILWEQDYYYSGRMIPSIDGEGGPTEEMLTVTYSYACEHFTFVAKTDNPAVQSLEDHICWNVQPSLPKCACQKSGFRAQTNEETLKVVDKILEIWGIDRLK